MRHSATHTDPRQGSVVITALLFAAVFSLTLGSIVSYTSHINQSSRRDAVTELALHVAESGIEMGMHALNSGLVTSTSWDNDVDFDVDVYTAGLDVLVAQDSTDTDMYDIYAYVKIPFSNGRAITRAVHTRVQATPGTTTQSTPGSGGEFPYAVYARNEVTVQHGNGDKRPRFASYDSDLTTDPVYGTDTGYDASLVTPSSSNSAIKVNNAIIDGVLNSGGGTISYTSGRNNPNQVDQNLWLSMSDEDSGTSINSDGIRTSFNGTVNDPTYPTEDGYTVPSGQTTVSANTFWKANDNEITFGVDQNFWQNGQNADANAYISASGSDRTIGADDTHTMLTTPSITLQNGSKLTVKGDVVLYVKRNFNIHGDIEFEEGATLTLIASENNHFTGSTNNAKPIQFQVTPYVDLTADSPSGPNVQFNNTDRIAMVVNAPYSKVSTGGQGNGTFDYMGAIIANNFECPNGVNFSTTLPSKAAKAKTRPPKSPEARSSRSTCNPGRSSAHRMSL